MTGRRALFIGRHAFGIPGLAAEESERLLDELLDFACRPPRVLRHRWQPGDLAIWDNRCVLHRARPYDPNVPRVMHHTRIAGDPATESGLAQPCIASPPPGQLRSQRVLWCLEELGVDYEIVKHQRDAQTNLAPESLKVIQLRAEGAARARRRRVDVRVGRDPGPLVLQVRAAPAAPSQGSEDWLRYNEWLHYAERLGDAAGDDQARSSPRLGEAEVPDCCSRVHGAIDVIDFGFSSAAANSSARATTSSSRLHRRNCRPR